jgi:hypothetical protein
MVAWGSIALAIVAFALCLRPSHFERGEAIIDLFPIAPDVKDIPKEETANAIREYQESISYDEGRPEAYDRLVWIYCLTGHRKSAIEWKGKAKGRVPASVMAEIEQTIKLYDETGSWPESKK